MTNLMVDVPAMALVAAAVAAWIKGIDEESPKWLAVGSIIAGLGLLTKYNSAVVLPLILFYAVLHERRRAAIWLLLPLGMFGLWCIQNYLTLPGNTIHVLHGMGRFEGERIVYEQLALSLLAWGSSFVFLPALAIRTWARGRGRAVTMLLGVGAVLVGCEIVLLAGPHAGAGTMLHRISDALGQLLVWGPLPTTWSRPMHLWPEQLIFFTNSILMLLFVLAGLLGRPGSSKPARPDATLPDDLFLLVWILGISLFNLVFAPHHSPRYYFPAFPAFALLLVRALGRLPAAQLAWTRPLAWGSVGIQLGIGLILVASDNTFARSAQNQVERLAGNPLVRAHGVSYIGHWGFQYFSQQHPRFERVDVREPPPEVGGMVAILTYVPGAVMPWWLKRERGAGGGISMTMARQPELVEIARRGGINPLEIRRDFDYYGDVEALRRGEVPRGSFRLVADWAADHPWPLQTIDVERGPMLYAVGSYHVRLPYGRGVDRTHRMILLQRVR